jgi:hypothetical protein
MFAIAHYKSILSIGLSSESFGTPDLLYFDQQFFATISCFRFQGGTPW